jgi:hypothetical protein
MLCAAVLQYLMLCDAKPCKIALSFSVLHSMLYYEKLFTPYYTIVCEMQRSANQNVFYSVFMILFYPYLHFSARYMHIKDTQSGSPSSKSPSSSSVSTGKNTGKKSSQYEWLEYPVATTSNKYEREKEIELERVKEKEREREIQICEKTIQSIPTKKKKVKQIKRSSFTVAEWGSGPAPGYLQERCSSREGRRSGTAPERGRQVSMEREIEEERGRIMRIERERLQAEIEEAEILAVITGRSCSTAPLDTRQHTHRLPSDLNRSSPFFRTYESTCTYDETDVLKDGWTSLDYESSGKQLQCRDRERDRERDSAPREHDFLTRTYERVERGSAERKCLDAGRRIAFTRQSLDSTDTYAGKDTDGESESDMDRVREVSDDAPHGTRPLCIPFPLTAVGYSSPPSKAKNIEISSGMGSGIGSGSLSRPLKHRGDRDRDMAFETSDTGGKRIVSVSMPVSMSISAISRREEEDRDYLNLPLSTNKCDISRHPSHSEDIVFINKRSSSGKHALSKSQKILIPAEFVGNFNGTTGISGKEMIIPSKALINAGR